MIDEFLYRRPIPEEKRGGTYHVVLNLSGKLVGPMTADAAAAQGFALPDILAEINAAAHGELQAEQAAREAAQSEKAAATAEAVEATKLATAAVQKAAQAIAERDAAITLASDLQKQLDAAKAEAVEVGPANPVLNAITFGLLGN